MDRLSFLKTIGVGIATAVIAPKIVFNELSKSESQITTKCLKINQGHAFTENRHFEEDFHIIEQKVCLWGLIMDKDEKVYVVTYLDGNSIGLTSVLAETSPNEMMIDKKYFGEYFIIFGSAFAEGTGMPL